ncbi:MAG: PilZ domain-containing protein [Gemmataceae bacterium]
MAARTPTQNGTGSRRVTARHPSRLKTPCQLRLATEEGKWLAALRNISADGICILSNRCFRPGMTLTLELPVSGQPLQLRMRVMHAKPQRKDWWLVGGQLYRQLSKAELDSLRNRAPAIAPSSERRTQARHTTRVKSAPVIKATEAGCWPATIRNVSETGISLITTRPFLPGCILTIDLPVSGGHPARARLLRVRHVRQQGDSSWWVLGGDFLGKLSLDEVRKLV